MPADPFRFALELICRSPELAAEVVALAEPGAGARARRIALCLRALARNEDGEREILVRGPGLAAQSGSLCFVAREVHREARRAMLEGEPACLVSAPPDATRALARLCASLGIDASAQLEAARTSNDVLVAFGRREGIAAVAHLGCDPSIRAPLENHARVLTELQAEAEGLGLRGLVARPLRLAIEESSVLLLQTRLLGAAPDCARLSESELDTLLELGLAPLARVHSRGVLVREGPDAELVHRRFPRLLDLLPDYRDALRPAIEHVRRWQVRLQLPAVRVHGDYWLGNLLFETAEHASPRLAGIVDWDRSRAKGLPGIDALHLGVASVAEWLRKPMGEVLAGVWEPKRRHPRFALHLARAASALALDAAILEHLALALWLGYLDDACAGTGRPHARWTALAIEAPAAAVREWLRRAGAGAGARA